MIQNIDIGLSEDLSCNPILANILISYTLKTPENDWFYGVFREWEHWSG